MKKEDENDNINTAAEKEPKNALNSREVDKMIADYYKQAGGI